MAAVTKIKREALAARPEASMEPRLIGRGNAGRVLIHTGANGASMEPRLIGRGNRHLAVADGIICPRSGRWHCHRHLCLTEGNVWPWPTSLCGRQTPGQPAGWPAAWPRLRHPPLAGQGAASQPSPPFVVVTPGNATRRTRTNNPVSNTLRPESAQPQQASMEPRLIGRGNEVPSNDWTRRWPRFNGAAAHWPR